MCFSSAAHDRVPFLGKDICNRTNIRPTRKEVLSAFLCKKIKRIKQVIWPPGLNRKYLFCLLISIELLFLVFIGFATLLHSSKEITPHSLAAERQRTTSFVDVHFIGDDTGMADLHSADDVFCSRSIQLLRHIFLKGTFNFKHPSPRGGQLFRCKRRQRNHCSRNKPCTQLK